MTTRFLKKTAILPAALETRVLGLSVFPGNWSS